MADGVTLPPSGTGDVNPKASTQQVTSDQTHVQDVSLTSVVGGVRTRNPVIATSSAAASQVDGHSANIGLLADASSSNTLTGLLKAIKAAITGTVAVSGTFWQATQPVSGTVTASGPVTDAQLRATPVPVSGTVTASGPVTDAQLRATPVPVSGTVTASGPVTDTQLRATPVPVSGTVTATGPVTDTQLRASAVPVQAAPRAATTATLTNTASSASNVANLVALNTNRLGLTIFNDSSAILFLKYGTTASATSFTYEIPALAQWEMPVDPTYTGRIDGIWASANGNARITEFTA